MLKKTVFILILSIILALGSCRLLMPERFAVNAPMLSMIFGRSASTPSQDEVDSRMRVPPGFRLSVYADDISNIRWLRFSDAGDLLVTRPRAGEVLILGRDRNRDGRADGKQVLLSGLNRPHGLELRDGWLYVGETDAIARIRFDSEAGRTKGELERIVTGLPGGGNHWSRSLGFGPDGKLYVSVGSSCNACLEEDERRAALLRFDADGSEPEIFATGLRNAVGFDWQPSTGRLYATDNGRDLLGDDFPPCELNQVEQGGFYGWPIANGDRVPDPDLGAGLEERISSSIPPAHDFRAHNAPLGMSFVRGDEVPEAYRGAALVALHGSWNRTHKDGYKVVSLHWSPQGEIREQDFMVGFEVDGDVIGRPVHVVQGPDQSFYVTDDYAGLIWRVAWGDSIGGADQPVTHGGAARSGSASPLASLSPSEIQSSSSHGRSLYAQHACASCHEPGATPEGIAVKELTGLAARYSIEDLSQLLATPPSSMPVVPLSAEERRDLAIYLLNLD